MRGTKGLRAAAVAAAMGVLFLAAPSTAEDAPAPASEQSAAPTGYLATATWQLLAEVNKHRRSKGLVQLTVDKGLAGEARTWAEQMARTDVLSHNDGLFSTASRQRLGMRLLGENVGVNTGVAAQHKAFMASRGHRVNIEYAAFRVAGFAVVRDANGRIWAVEDFGTRR